MYNTQVINPAYTSANDGLSFGLLTRTQWVGFDGAPKTSTFTVSNPFWIKEKMGIGLSIVHDKIGPAIQGNYTIDYAYTFYNDYKSKITLGLKAGINSLSVDFSRLNIYDLGDVQFENNIKNRISPQIGAGVYYNTDRFYAGLSIPNFLSTRHYDTNNGIGAASVARNRMHYYLITGYVWDINPALKFKPAAMVKIVRGSPMQLDLSANFLINEALTLGAAYRLSAALSGLVGFQVSDSVFLGFAYDYQTTALQEYSSGSYELILRLDILNKVKRVLTPRFF
jgi:type IX secretion system PorP/SprF family membrane protein